MKRIIKKSAFAVILCSLIAIVAASAFIFINDSFAAGGAEQISGIVNITAGKTDMLVSRAENVPVGRTELPERVVIGGFPFGVKYYADGVLVVGMSDVQTRDGMKNPAFESGLRVKDVVLSVDGQSVSNETFSQAVQGGQGKPLRMKVRRGSLYFDINVTPVMDNDGVYRLGCLVRDSTAGIGSVTFIDPESGVFGGLGHGVCDVDTGELFTLSHATVYGAKIRAVVPGKVGTPGELKGSFNEDVFMGTLYKNCDEGVFGTLDDGFEISSSELISVAGHKEIKEGDALIRCTVDGEGAQYYGIKIVRVFSDNDKKTKNMVIQITDEKLLAKTGGIVQGMSGSPIIQNGKLIGAVTHVMVNDPTRGYGISIENMLYAS